MDAPKRLSRVGGQASVLIVTLVCAACGKKGPPLPPLVKLPVAPAELRAERRGNDIDLHFIVPATNTDGSRPANITRAEVYAITASATSVPANYTDYQILKYGTKVGVVDVKAPKDPNLTADADEPEDEVDAPEGKGLDQGTLAHIDEPLSAGVMKPNEVRADPQAPNQPAPVADDAAPRPPPPPPPGAPAITYDETTITVTWPAIDAKPSGTTDGVLPSRIIGVTRPAITYNVYDVTDPDAPIKLTATPVAAPTYADPRLAWGEERCYAIRAAERVVAATIESEASPSGCETPVDTFPPAAPKGLVAIASEGAISLIWEPNAERDLDGYIVLRALAPSDALEPITPAPIKETALRDGVQAGLQYIYAVRAVDKAGNASPPSARVTETAR